MNVLSSASARYRSLKGPFRPQLKHSEQLRFIWVCLFFCSSVTYSMFLLQSSWKGDKQDGKNSGKKGFFLNNMPPELLHGNKGINYVAIYLIWILIVFVLSVCLDSGLRLEVVLLLCSICRPEFQMWVWNRLLFFMAAIALRFPSEVSAKACWVQADTAFIYCEFSQVKYTAFI